MGDTRTRHWAGETVPVPQRIKGERVVAAIKLPTHPDMASAHQYAVVTEGTSDGLYCYHRAFWAKDGYQSMHREMCRTYGEALRRVLQNARPIWDVMDE